MALLSSEDRIEKMEGVREKIVDALIKADIDKLGVKELTLLEKTITSGTKIAMAQQEQEQRKKSEAGEEAYRQAATAFIIAQREAGNRRAQQVREGNLTGGAASLPQVEDRELAPNEGLQGQFQVGFDVLSGQKTFVPEENLPPAAREILPEI